MLYLSGVCCRGVCVVHFSIYLLLISSTFFIYVFFDSSLVAGHQDLLLLLVPDQIYVTGLAGGCPSLLASVGGYS